MWIWAYWFTCPITFPGFCCNFIWCSTKDFCQFHPCSYGISICEYISDTDKLNVKYEVTFDNLTYEIINDFIEYKKSLVKKEIDSSISNLMKRISDIIENKPSITKEREVLNKYKLSLFK